MKTKIGVCIALAWLIVISCQAKTVKGNGQIVTKEVPVNEYRSIAFSGSSSGSSFNLWGLLGNNSNNNGKKTFICHYSQQKQATLSITIDENLYEYLSIRSENGKLEIRVQKGCSLVPTCYEVTTGSKEMEEINVNGGADFYLDTPLSGSSLKVSSSGGSDVYMKKSVRMESCECNSSGGSDLYFDDLTCNRFSCSSSGGSDISLKGQAEEAEMDASGGSDIKAYSFIVSHLTCHASGGSDAYVYATQQLDARASGGSDIYHKGSAQVSASASGGSDITKKD